MNTKQAPLIPLGCATSVVDSTVRGLPDPPPGAVYAYIQAQGGVLRWFDAIDPTATTGHVIADSEDYWYIGNLHRFRFVKKASEPDHVLTVSYYKATP